MQSFTVTGLTFNTTTPVSASYIPASDVDGVVASASVASCAVSASYSPVQLPNVSYNASTHGIGINQPTPQFDLDVCSPTYPYIALIGNSSGSLAITATSTSGSQDIEIVPSVGINPTPGNVFIEGGPSNGPGADAGIAMVAGGYYYSSQAAAPVTLNPNGQVGINLGLSGSWINRPHYTLDLSGSINFTSGSLLNNGQAFTASAATMAFTANSAISASYSPVQLPAVTYNASLHALGVNQTNPMFNLDVCNVGTPQAIVGNSSGSLVITTTSTSGSQDISIVPSVGINPTPGNLFLFAGGSSSPGLKAGNVVVGGGSTSATSSAAVVINPQGNVGINLGVTGANINLPNANYALEVGGIIGNSHGDLSLQMDGDVYGSSKLHLWNRAGSNGAVFENPSDALVDFGFLSNLGTSKQNNIRLEQRNGYTVVPGNNPASGGYGEFQFSCNTGYNEFFYVGNNGAAFNCGKVGIQKTNPAYTLDVSGDINYTGTLRHNGAPLLQAGTASFSLTGVINFATAFANTNYSVVLTATGGTNASFMVGPKTTTSCGFTASIGGSGMVNFIAMPFTQ